MSELLAGTPGSLPSSTGGRRHRPAGASRWPPCRRPRSGQRISRVEGVTTMRPAAARRAGFRSSATQGTRPRWAPVTQTNGASISHVGALEEVPLGGADGEPGHAPGPSGLDLEEHELRALSALGALAEQVAARAHPVADAQLVEELVVPPGYPARRWARATRQGGAAQRLVALVNHEVRHRGRTRSNTPACWRRDIAGPGRSGPARRVGHPRHRVSACASRRRRAASHGADQETIQPVEHPALADLRWGRRSLSPLRSGDDAPRRERARRGRRGASAGRGGIENQGFAPIRARNSVRVAATRRASRRQSRRCGSAG